MQREIIYQMDELRFIILAAIGILSLILALWHGSIWENRHPEKLGFKWGYFVIYNSLINNILIFGFLLWAGIDEGDIGLFLFGVAALGTSAAIAYFSVQRSRWALILSTILSINLLWMFINIFYLKNRWSEFRSETSSAASAQTVERLKALPRDMRVAIFTAIAWGVCVPSYVFLFEPYGSYMRDDDTFHMLGVIFLPTLIGLGLFLIYRKFVR
mgnify:CR=1 FL=1